MQTRSTPGEGLANDIPGCLAGTVPSVAIPTSPEERQVLSSQVQLQSALLFLTQCPGHSYAN